MEIKIKISKRLAEHPSYPHTFYDCCSEAEEVLIKVQKAIEEENSK